VKNKNSDCQPPALAGSNPPYTGGENMCPKTTEL